MALLKDSGVGGGLCVQIGCKDATVLSPIVKSGAFIGFGLCETLAGERAVTDELSSQGLHGLAFCASGTLSRLVLSDNMVNLLIVDDLTPALQQKLAVAEVMRVLCPYGVAYFGQRAGGQQGGQQLKDAVAAWGLRDYDCCEAGGAWIKVVKKYPGAMDQWTHLRHGPENNPVSHDALLKVPNSLRWIAGPSCTGAVPSPWNYLAGGAGKMVSAHGRNIYLVSTGEDEGCPVQALMVRDACNGLLLWARRLPKISARAWLVAEGDSLFTEINDEIVKVDARTGQTLASYGTSDQLRQTLLCGNILMLTTLDKIRAFDVTSDKLIWSVPTRCWKAVAEAGVLYCLDAAKSLTAVNLTNGVTIWTKPVAEWIQRSEDFLFVRKGVIVFEVNKQDGIETHVFSAANGVHLWVHKNHTQVFDAYSRYGDDVFYVGDSIWKLTTVKGGVPDDQGGATSEVEELDPQTGAVKSHAATSATLIWRCYPLPATDQYLIGNRPPSFMSWADKITVPFRGTRSGCGAGLIIANGLLYTSYLGGCHCVQEAVNGFAAFATDAAAEPKAPAFPLERLAPSPSPVEKDVGVGAGWPMFRRDAARSSATTEVLPDQLKILWETSISSELAGNQERTVLQADWSMKQFASDALTGSTLSGGRLFVSRTDAAEVVALDQRTGRVLWRRAVGGRLDSPPTCYRNLCLVGAHDGWVYALRADDGQVVWRLRAAPDERRVVAFGQIESPWPVIGGVLLQDEVAYCLAGRDTEVDGGIFLHAFNPATGGMLWTEKMGRWMEGPATFAGPANVLSCDGRAIFIGGEPTGAVGLQTHRQFKASETFGVTAFTSAHLRKHCQTLDCPSASNERVLCVRSAAETELLAYDQSDDDERDADGKGPLVLRVEIPKNYAAEALVNASDKLIAGMSQPKSGSGAVWVFSLRNSAKTDEIQLKDAPVREGLAVAGGCIYVSTRGGKVVCLGKP